MFGNNKKKENASPKNGVLPSTTKPNALNSLVHGTVVEGTIKAENDMRVDGVIKGALKCKSKVIIGPTGSVEGEIRCKNAVIEGRFDGTLSVEELLNVRESAHVNGDVKTNKLIVQSGAVFNVACKMGVQSQNNGSFESKKVAQSIVKQGSTPKAGVAKEAR